MFFEKGKRVFNGDCGSGSGIRLGARLGQTYRLAAQPKTFHEADHRARVGIQHRRTALAFHDRMAEKKDAGCWGRLFELRGFEIQNRARRRIFALGIETVRIPNPLRVERKREHRLSPDDGAGSQRERCNTVAACEGIGRSAENGDVMLKVLRDDADLKQFGRGVRSIHENVWLAAFAKRFQDVRNG